MPLSQRRNPSRLRRARAAACLKDLPCWLLSLTMHLAMLLVFASLVVPVSDRYGLPPLILQLVNMEGDERQSSIAESIVVAQPPDSPNHDPAAPSENPPDREPPEEERRDAPQLTSAPNEEKPAKKDLPSPTALLKIARRKLDADLAPPRITRVASIGADDDSPERRRMNGIVDQFILYDIGRLSGKKAQWAKLEFDRLGQAAIPSLVYGVNKAAYYGQSCPIIAISRKLRDELSRSQDPAMIAYALENIGRGVADNAPYAARVRGLRRQLADELGRTDVVIREKLQAGGLPADPQMVSLVRSLANSPLGELETALHDRAPRVRLAAVIALDLCSDPTRSPNNDTGRLLAQALDDANPLIRNVTEDILNELTHGANLGQDSGAWVEYWRALERAERLRRATTDQLSAALQNDDWRVRSAAAAATADGERQLTIGQTVHLAKQLLDLLERDRPEVQHAAWEALQELSPSGAPITDRPRDEAALREAVRRWRAHWEQFEAQHVIEPRANSYLKMAKRLEAVGKSQVAAGRYRRVMTDFPGSSAAAEARCRLLAMGSD